MYARKNHDKASKNAKEPEIQLSGLSLLISQAKVAEKTKQQTTGKGATTKQPPQRTSPRRRPLQTRADDLKNTQGTFHRHQSPSPSRAHTRASSSPGAVGCTTDGSKRSEDGGGISPASVGHVYGRMHWTSGRKPSGRSRHTDSQSAGRPKVTIRKTDNDNLYIKRTSEERAGDPERIVLDRFSLSTCPVIEGEEQLRLINYQHNQIMKIENVSYFPYLMFLDLSDNCIECISGLETIATLRVLLLGRNRIKQISGLDSLTHLDVLDLSGNQIKEICNICHLQELRVLNLSSNQLTQVKNLKGLNWLLELNLNKNSIAMLSEVDVLPRLQRLFVSHNLLERFEDMSCTVNVGSLTELTLEGCPVTQKSNYRYLILFRLPTLKFLDMRRVLDEERRTAQMVMRKEELKRQESIRLAKIKEAREKAIANAHLLWEAAFTERSEHLAPSADQQLELLATSSAVPLQLLAAHTRFHSVSEEEEDALCSFCEGSGVSCEFCDGTNMGPSKKKINAARSRKNRSKYSKKIKEAASRSSSKKASKSPAPVELEVADSKLTYLAEVEEGILQLYGPGAVAAAVEHSWHPQTVSSIHTVGFHYVMFDQIVPHLAKLKMQFPNVASLSFQFTAIHALPQLNALGQISGLQTLTIEEGGNPITQLSLWKLYAIYRLGPSLIYLNGATINTLEKLKAEDVFGGIGQITSTLLPKYRLSSLLNSPRVKQFFLKEKGYSPNSLQRQPESQVASDVVMKASLTYNPYQNELSLPKHRISARIILEKSLECVNETMKKRLVFQRVWPSILLDLVRDSLQECSNLDRHMKHSMQSVLRNYKASKEESDK